MVQCRLEVASLRTLCILGLLITLAVPVFAQQDGNLLMQDNFSTRANRWSLPESAKAKVDYVEGQLVMTVNSPGAAIWSVPDSSLELSRYHLTINAQIEPGSSGALGVVFHYQDDENFYWWEISDEGYYHLNVVKEGKTPRIPLAEGSVQPAQSFQISLTVINDEFKIVVNDQELPTILNKTISDGIFGLYTRADRGAMQATFDDLRVVDIQLDD
jgi:hypothetical protein